MTITAAFPASRTRAIIYTPSELEQIRSLISRLRHLSPDEIAGIDAAVSSGACPAHLAPLAFLSSTNPGLFDKLRQDNNTATYSIYGLFPIAYELIYESDTPPQITFNGRTRGRVAILRSATRNLVIKPLQSQREGQIAEIAGRWGVGPAQHLSLPGFITEEFVSGRFFTELTREEITSELLYGIGLTLGEMLRLLHQNEIYYNDATLSDPDGRSHLLVMEGGSCRLIDFGVSVLLDRHPDLEAEEVYNYVRTLPMFQMFTRMGASQEDVANFVRQYRGTLAQTPKSEILTRDLRFFEEGLRLSARRTGEDIIKPLHGGFQDSYGEP